MIQFSTQGGFLLLVTQGGRGGGALIQDRALIWDRVLISFLRNKQMFKTKL